MNSEFQAGKPLAEPVDYEKLVDMFNQALIHTLRKHSVADSFLDFWVPDADPVLGIAGMVDSARMAGLQDISIRFTLATVPAERLPDLQQAIANVGQVTLKVDGQTVLLRAANMRQTGSPELAAANTRPKPTYWQATAGSTAPAETAELRWESAELPEFADVHPHFRAALQAASERLSREGAMQATPGLLHVSGSEGSITLTLAVDVTTHAVQTARHTGAGKPSERAVLDLFCKTAEHLPIQEVADHAALKVLQSLVDEDKAFPVPGILLPANAGAPFTLLTRVARRAYQAYRAQTGAADGTNFYYAPPAAEWQNLTADERRERIDYVLRAFLQSEGLYPDDMAILRVEKNKYGYHVRVIVGFSDRVPTAEKPNLMRRLEQRLRRDLEPEIDLVADRVRDTSPLRRLS